MPALQKPDLAPGTTRHFPSSHYLHITWSTMVLFSAFMHDPGGHGVCGLLKNHLHFLQCDPGFSVSRQLKLNQKKKKKVQIHPFASEHKPKQLNNTFSLSRILFSRTICPTFRPHQGPVNRVALFPGPLMSLKLGGINCLFSLSVRHR